MKSAGNPELKYRNKPRKEHNRNKRIDGAFIYTHAYIYIYTDIYIYTYTYMYQSNESEKIRSCLSATMIRIRNI